VDSQQLSVREKVGYSLGDLAANLIFQTLVTFLTFFYTDVFGIPAAAAGVVTFTGGIVAAFFGPVMGLIADRTRTRWGKFRPWILWTSVPFGVVALLAFSTPDLGPQGKVFYALLTYILLVIIYTANNLPYAALSGVLTSSMAERNSISSYRFVAVMVAQFVIQVLLLPLVLILGDGDKAQGFHNTMVVFAIVGTVFFLITFFTTRERVAPVVERSSIADDLRDLIRNRPWTIMLVLTILVFATLALKGGMYIYYFQNYVSEPALAKFLDEIGLDAFIAGLNFVLTSTGLTEFQWPKDAPTSGFGLFNAGGIIFMIVGISFSKRLADKYGKRDVFGMALLLSTLCMLAFYLYPPDAIRLIFVSQVLHGFFYGITIPLLWAMIADVADYSEWKNNRRATAVIFSAMILGLKLGLAIGGALVGAILDHYGYQAGLQQQSAGAIEGTRIAISVYAALPFLIACALLFAYAIDKTFETRIEQDLEARRHASNL
jgi:Na+/melibiose symporter-like transporter